MIFDPSRDVIDDSRVEISKSENSFNPPPISPYGNEIMAFQVIANAALQVAPPLENVHSQKIRCFQKATLLLAPS